MNEAPPLRILWVEDSPEDAEYFSGLLEEQGLAHGYRRVDDEASLLAALRGGRFDVAISDLELPGFSGHRALVLVREHAPGLPFVFLSGAMGEDTAVLALQQGATDYVLKPHPTRLGSAVRRAVREAEFARERERMDAELVRAQRNEALALLVAGLSHDLRNVLQPLSLWPHLLRANPEPAVVARAAAVIEECARRGHDLAQAMIDFARGQNQAQDSCTVGDVLDSVRLLLAGSVPSHVTVAFADDTGGHAVRGHATELQQCLLNLCLNAVQAMEPLPQGRLEVAAYREAERVRIEVRDTGPGMEPAVVERLFTPFFTTKRDGTGLGLLSCRRIVESLGGVLDVETRVGLGTTMRLALPAVASRAPVASPTTA
jgi:signal transduction histidine kinase